MVYGGGESATRIFVALLICFAIKINDG